MTFVENSRGSQEPVSVFCVVFLCFVCLCLVSCVPNVASVSGLSLSCVLCTQCCQCLWIVFVLCLVYPMLPVSLDCLRLVSCETEDEGIPETLATLGTQDTGQRQSRDTSSIGCSKHKTKTIQRHWKHWVHRTEDEDFYC
jgi:hypothetical protein